MYIRYIYTPNPTKEDEEYVETPCTGIGGNVDFSLIVKTIKTIDFRNCSTELYHHPKKNCTKFLCSQIDENGHQTFIILS